MISALVSIASGLVLLAEKLFQQSTTLTQSSTRRVAIWLFFTFCALLVIFACISITFQSTGTNKTVSSESAPSVPPTPTPTPSSIPDPIVSRSYAGTGDNITLTQTYGIKMAFNYVAQ